MPRDGATPSAESTGLLANLTNRYSGELKEIDVAAILGGPVLRRFALGMHLDEGRVSFYARRRCGGDGRAGLGGGDRHRT